MIAGGSQRRFAKVAEPALTELQVRVADRLKIDSFRIMDSARNVESDLYVLITFGLALLLTVGAALYALIH